jgi:hypothetical protein
MGECICEVCAKVGKYKLTLDLTDRIANRFLNFIVGEVEPPRNFGLIALIVVP